MATRKDPSGGIGVLVRFCLHCAASLEGRAPTTRTCGKRCRQARWRRAQEFAIKARADEPLRLAVADEPYPGLSKRYYGTHPDYGGEVDHGALLSQLVAYDGWALATNRDGLKLLVGLCQERQLDYEIAIWVRGARKAPSRTAWRSYEAVLYRRARAVVSREPGEDVLVHHAHAPTTEPGRVVGTKSARWCAWVFDLLGARPGDQLDDLFPGSGAVSRAWTLFTERSSHGRTTSLT